MARQENSRGALVESALALWQLYVAVGSTSSGLFGIRAVCSLMGKQPPNPSGSRMSQSAKAARQAEFERIKQMTPLERMALALQLGRRRLKLEQARRST